MVEPFNELPLAYHGFDPGEPASTNLHVTPDMSIAKSHGKCMMVGRVKPDKLMPDPEIEGSAGRRLTGIESFNLGSAVTPYGYYWPDNEEGRAAYERKYRVLNLSEKLPPTPTTDYPKYRYAFHSPRWVALHEEVPRYFYHVPEGKVTFGKTIKAYKIQEPEFADDFGRGYKDNRYVWLSLKPIYYADAYVIDITRLNNDDIRFTGQVEGNILHRGDIPPSAVVAIRKSNGEMVYR